MKSKVIIKDSGEIARVVSELRKVRGAVVKVGVLGEDANIVRTSRTGGSMTLGEIAQVNEFGSRDGRIPARPFMRNTWDALKPELRALQRRTLERIAAGTMGVEQGLGLIGEWFAGAVKKTITAGVPPPNAPRTIALKGSSKPLIDTGQLRQSITHVVEMQGGASSAPPTVTLEVVD